MTKNEWVMLFRLIARVEKTSDLIHHISGVSLLKDASEKTPTEIMEDAIRRLDIYDLYIKYIHLDREAGLREITELQNIIEKTSEK